MLTLRTPHRPFIRTSLQHSPDSLATEAFLRSNIRGKGLYGLFELLFVRLRHLIVCDGLDRLDWRVEEWKSRGTIVGFLNVFLAV
ncbi:hypothetical protein F5Y10DRAFT_274024 [Nemania abortiva]|nr:hypothetical protein F5Y10DRAFT_274024 [Nemania abortiva]